MKNILLKGLTSSLLIASVAFALPASAMSLGNSGLHLGLGVKASASASSSHPNESATADLHANANAAFKSDKHDDDNGDKDKDSGDEHENQGKGDEHRHATSTATSTPDTSAPRIFGPFSYGMSTTSAQVVWFTSEPSTSAVYFSTGTPVVAAPTTASVSSGSLVWFHHLSVTGLNPGTTYHYIVVSADASGNKATSSERSFMTH